MPQSVSSRMRQLQSMLEKEPDETFLLYGLALEYKKMNDSAHAIEFLDRVIVLDPGYCYAYYQKGLVYEEAGDVNAAQSAYRAGIAAATKKGDNHARQEIEAALQMIE